MEQITTFLTAPELPDLIAYVILTILYIREFFIKAFVKKDNLNTLIKVDLKNAKLAEMQKQYELNKIEYENEKKKLEYERNEMKKEIALLKTTIRVISGRSKELVSNGTTNYILKMIPPTADELKTDTIKLEETRKIKEEQPHG